VSLILLNPGPVTLSPRVRRALGRADLCHREPEFAALQSGIRAKLLAVYGLDPGRWAAILLTGSGTAAVEAMLCSLVPREAGLVTVENGVYGERLTRIGATHRIECRPVAHPWTAPPSAEALAATLRDHPRSCRVGLVHHETTTGRLNDVGACAVAAGGVPFLLDAVSSFGGEAIDFAGWNLGACAATANKCLHGVPGTAFVVTRRDLLEDTGRGVYLNLADYCRAQDAGTTPFTQSVQTFYALDEALDELLEEGGWEARRAEYRRRMRTVRDHLVGLGVEPLLPEGASSCVLNSFRLPPGLPYARLHDGLKAAGFVIYAGQGELARTLFRVSTMGAIADCDLERLLAALSRLLC
jgi:2-aminoethylphosphonate-pyruvate transaminase